MEIVIIGRQNKNKIYVDIMRFNDLKEMGLIEQDGVGAQAYFDNSNEDIIYALS